MSVERPEGEPEAERVEALLPLARALRDAIDRRLATDDDGIVFDVDRILDQAFLEVAKDIAVERLAALSPVEFAELYGRLAGESHLRELLEALSLAKTQALEREVRLATITQEVLRTGMLRLEQLLLGEAITIGLFDPAHPRMAAKRFADDAESRALHRILSVRILDPTTGYAEVLHDVWVGPVWAEPQRGNAIRSHTRGHLGSEVITQDGAVLEPTLSLHSQLAYRFGAEQQTMAPVQIIGYVEASSGELLLGK